ncbi:type II toxin-antitoxin system HipA family toxin [Pseudochelatococcus sp. G4_1912]|uniref:type II toxin-antitoxin system HipA family toxin n=1 Tax=Pseudochelatococcus sp. G4_1912 TaxID=3114288 RepID=UPI0039C669A5
MARTRKNPPLRVLLNGLDVGMLTRASSGAIDFQYAREWLDWEHAIPVSLSLPLREDRYIGAPVIAVLENLLPDNKAIRDRVAAKVRASGTDAFSLLSKIGHDCVGALQFLPENQNAGKAGAIESHPISDEEIARKIADLKSAPLGMDENEDFRISIAGAQEKTALLYHDGKWQLPIGTTATTHIIKPQIGEIPNGLDLSNSVENEYLCLHLCKAFGLNVANAEIVDFAGTKALAVERFDRIWTRDGRLLRKPQEDMCQALSVPPILKYQSDGGPDNQAIMQLLKGSDRPMEDQLAYLKAQIIFWLIGATDGHAKNFSIFLMPGARFSMTPLYDVLTAQPSVDSKQININKLKLAMSVGDNNHYKINEITPRHFLQTADRCSFDKGIIRAAMEEILEAGQKTALTCIESLPVKLPEALVESTIRGIKQRIRSIELWAD